MILQVTGRVSFSDSTASRLTFTTQAAYQFPLTSVAAIPAAARKVPWNRRRSSTDTQWVEVSSFATYACTLTELTTDETANIQRLVDDTWRDTNTSFGADATGLRHKTIKIHRVYDIANDALERPYLEALEQSLNNFALPEEIVSKPIQTQHVQHGYDQLRHGEVLLFHGAAVDRIDRILQEGFQLRHSARGLYGHPAVYLAESAQKADQYTDGQAVRRTRQLAMLVVRVALGHTELYENQAPGVDYDTIVGGSTSRFREFVKTKAEQICPKYIICYDRES